ncbi:MAG: hypothetical protein OHK0047_31340 [Leptolyngbyaceae cyanobacterium]
MDIPHAATDPLRTGLPDLVSTVSLGRYLFFTQVINEIYPTLIDTRDGIDIISPMKCDNASVPSNPVHLLE